MDEINRQTRMNGRMLALILRRIEEQATAEMAEAFYEELIYLREENDRLLERAKNECEDDNQMDKYIVDYESMLGAIIMAMGNLRKLDSTINQKDKSVDAEPTTSCRQPAIELPKFNGDIAEWSAFSSLFLDGINTTYKKYTSSQKLSLLLTHLTGSAKATVANVTPANFTFDEAWELLKEKYENKRNLSNEAIMRLVNHKDVSTAAELEKFTDTIREVMRSLALLGYENDHFSLYMSPVILSKLDSDTVFHWEQSQYFKEAEVPEAENIIKFLRSWCGKKTRAVTTTKQSLVQNPSSSVTMTPRGDWAKAKEETRIKRAVMCAECKKDHSLSQCPTFVKATVNERWQMVRKLKLCTNCLGFNHMQITCKSGGCRTCGKRHNTMLHNDFTQVPPKVVAATNDEREMKNYYNVHSVIKTAIITMKDAQGRPQKMRAMIDGGSQLNLITEEACRRLKVPRMKEDKAITTALGDKTTTSETIYGEVESCASNFKTWAAFNIVSRIGSEIPSTPLPTKMLKNITKRLQLADPTYDTPAPIDILLGVGVYAEIFENDIKHYGNLIIQKTSLGWVLFGALQFDSPRKKKKNAMVGFTQAFNEFARFWELEELKGVKKMHTEEEEMVEKLTDENTRRDHGGRFVVKMPLKEEPPPLGQSRPVALARFRNLEKKFERQPTFADEYKKVFEEYIQLGHMEVAQNPPEENRSYYLPHHAVLKENSTTALRIVFDGSCKTTTDMSLNECQANGPRLQEEIFSILTRFRLHPIALTADIVKMYRQILVREEDRDLQRVLWRPTPNGPIIDYRLTTVVFGQRVSPYLAVKMLQYLAQSEPDEAVARVIRKDFYVDDLMTGAETHEEASAIQEKIQKRLNTAQFETHKWSSNDRRALVKTKNVNEDKQVKFGNEEENTMKTLGITWDTQQDVFSVRMKVVENDEWTRRSVLSATNSLYDPLGWIAPIMLVAKLQLQQIIKETKNLDQPLSAVQTKQWEEWYQEVPKIAHIKIPRCIKPAKTVKFILAGFCDASEKAYGAMVYAKAVTASGHTTINLIAAKTKVAPIKPVTLPRLELLGALLLSRLMATVAESLEEKATVKMAWTDSTVTLAWIKSHPSRWATFVAHRVNEIQENIDPKLWGHVKTADNPCDVASRGTTVDELIENKLWWQGPHWLQHGEDSGSQPLLPDPPEEKRLVATLMKKDEWSEKILDKFSTWSRLRGVIVRCLDFKNRLKGMKEGPDAKDYERADKLIIKWVQERNYAEEMIAVGLDKPVKVKSPLVRLNPMMEEEILRVKGRLENADIPYSAKYPIILPGTDKVTKLLIRHYHNKNLHAGPQQLSTLLREKYYILGGLRVIKEVTRRCITCARQKARLGKQLMASLPSPRVAVVSRPFTNTGVDFAGPVTLKTLLSRGARHYKAYIALFICFSTRAVHLELVTGLSSEAFLAAFARFTSRRGVPTNMYSDQGRNFVGAAKELALLVEREKKIKEDMATKGINWHFNPAYSPHHGGLWESNIGSLKTHLSKVIGVVPLNYEEYNTILCRAEAVLNSRPLMPMTSDKDDYEALTPAHFLTGGTLSNLPEENWSNAKINTLSRWQLTQKLSRDLWVRWSKEYLTRLHQRPKWWRKAPNMKEGCLVLIHDDMKKPLQWKMGRIIRTHPGADGTVRVATVKTAEGEMTRSIVKLVPLPMDTDDGNEEDND